MADSKDGARGFAKPALVASDQAPSGLDPAGFDPARITMLAKRMTGAQRRALLALPRKPDVWMTVGEMRPNGATGAGMDILYVYHQPEAERVCERRWTRWGGERGQKRGEGYEYSVTPLGVAVRAHINASCDTHPEGHDREAGRGS